MDPANLAFVAAHSGGCMELHDPVEAAPEYVGGVAAHFGLAVPAEVDGAPTALRELLVETQGAAQEAAPDADAGLPLPRWRCLRDVPLQRLATLRAIPPRSWRLTGVALVVLTYCFEDDNFVRMHRCGGRAERCFDGLRALHEAGANLAAPFPVRSTFPFWSHVMTCFVGGNALHWSPTVAVPFLHEQAKVPLEARSHSGATPLGVAVSAPDFRELAPHIVQERVAVLLRLGANPAAVESAPPWLARMALEVRQEAVER